MKTAFHVVYTVLALNFILPALVYAFAPGLALESMALVNGGPLLHSEDSTLWRVLAFANVMTLGFCCVLLQTDLRRWFPVLTPLLFLKAMAATGLAAAFIVERERLYLAGALLDGVTCGAMWFFATRARAEMGG